MSDIASVTPQTTSIATTKPKTAYGVFTKECPLPRQIDGAQSIIFHNYLFILGGYNINKCWMKPLHHSNSNSPWIFIGTLDHHPSYHTIHLTYSYPPQKNNIPFLYLIDAKKFVRANLTPLSIALDSLEASKASSQSSSVNFSLRDVDLMSLLKWEKLEVAASRKYFKVKPGLISANNYLFITSDLNLYIVDMDTCTYVML